MTHPLKLHYPHAWEVTPAQARDIQNRLKVHVITTDCFRTLRQVAGVDVGLEQQGQITRAAVAVLHFPGLAPEARAIARQPTRFPYVPGLLSFREIPAVLDALQQLSRLPDLILCDGQGLAHPRRFGIACHLGILTGIPTIGVAKTRLIGRFDEPGEEKGCWSPLLDGKEVIGAVLRTRTRAKPLFISVGHKISLPTALETVLACSPRFRLPETTRQAHRLASG